MSNRATGVVGVVIAWLFFRRHAKSSVDSPPDGEPASATPVADLPSAGASLGAAVRAELRWWFPSSIAVISVVTIGGLYLASNYYVGYFETFGLSPQQAGITRSDTILRLLPYAVLAGITLVLIRGLYIVVKHNHEPSTAASTYWQRHPVLKQILESGGLLLLLLFVAFGVAGFGDAMGTAGHEDANRVITDRRNLLYESQLQDALGLTSGLAEIEWLGGKEGDPLVGTPTDSSGRHHTIARLLAQSGETTFYLDLLDCTVYSLPTIDLQITRGLPTTVRGKTRVRPVLQHACKAKNG